MSLPAAAVMASALGAMTTQVQGAGLAMPGRAEVLTLLQAQGGEIEGELEVIRALTANDH
jgi:hypothetical protein